MYELVRRADCDDRQRSREERSVATVATARVRPTLYDVMVGGRGIMP